MKAVTYTEYGSPDVLRLTHIPAPTAADNEVLIRVRATSVGIGDLWARNFKQFTPRNFSMPGVLWLPARLSFGWNKPKVNILGGEFSGEVAAIGRSVTKFKVGDPVFGYRGQKLGANVEYLTMPEDGMVALKPTNMTFEEAATLAYGSHTALNLLRKVNIQPGQKVLINGASGGIGSYAVQFAKYFGAEVTGVCGTPRMEFVKALGADHVIDYTKQDFTQNGETYHVIFDIMNKSSFAKCRNSLTTNGRYLLASFKMKQLWQMLWTSRRDGQKAICALSNETPDDLRFIRELVEAGKIKTVVDQCFPLELAAEAHRYIESGHKKANVVLVVAQ
jgi:NADPH:quinone reductase-like Zn-dependent oxidoreductase